MVAAALLFSTYALPTYADTAPHEEPTSTRSSTPTQSLTVGEGVGTQIVAYDTYTIIAPVPPPAPVRVAGSSAGYTNTASTFTNDATAAVQWPFTRGVPITSGFGYRVPPCPTCSSDHSGVDFAPGAGTPIQAIADGTVTKSGNGGELGVNLAIDHVIDGQRITSIYAHMLAGSTTVKVGDPVTVGQVIGQVGNTGESTGAHLHLTVLRNGNRIDPFAWLKEKVGS